MVKTDQYFMQKALDAAWHYQGLTFPNPAVGAVIIDKHGDILACGAHAYAGAPHAEVVAIKEAYAKLTHDTKLLPITDAAQIHEYLYANHKGVFYDKTIFITLEPCNHFGKTPPCSQLLTTLHFKSVIIGTKDPNVNATGGYEKLQNACLHVKLSVLEDACKLLLEPFSIWQKKPFVFFKIAMHKNGVIDGGIVTCKTSRTHVHSLRDKIDLLVIGGNTVRNDRPILDARLVGGRAPDVLIYSKTKEFDRSIPLFAVPKRKVFIEDNLEKINEYCFVMIEGGMQMYEQVQNRINWLLVYKSNCEKEGKKFILQENLQELFTTKIATDTLTWYKKRC
ncbi:MAG: bifunctional diaminohydroxyphosphoribosylaminopyrimidine deaminase/5-amino-6-(5-phosphoribosylamino)uracil reductase RibD [Sulfurospirillum sp.]|nr:bifunctional diaminohydroxyphosphoribosylaminopyrimidine deaminase/5-amino-6-(5-phosphoribosylamino)uracil reductase RibD [Sulfurospirillum sp.]